MIQILGIRQFTDKKGKKEKIVTYDAFLDKNWRQKNHKDMFTNIDKVIADIPADERFNIFYTIAHCNAEKRSFNHSEILAFDIDEMDQDKKLEYIDIVLAAINLTRSNTTVIDSGNGLHFILQLKDHIKEAKYYSDRNNKTHYKAICNKINLAMASADLPGKTDTTIFDSRRILRLPGCENRKPGKEAKMPKVIFNNMTPLAITLQSMSGLKKLPELKKNESFSKKLLAGYKKPNISHIKEQCGFISHMYTDGSEMDEPSWYAALSIVTRCIDGTKEAHKLSKLSNKYDAANTEIKIEQAREASGPRVCSSIANLSFGGDQCNNCPLKDQIASPIQIRDKEDILTESTGFHQVIIDGNGNAKTKPFPNDMLRYYEREFHYKTVAGSRKVYKFNGKFYEEVADSTLEEFALQNYDPPVGIREMEEFRKMMCATRSTSTEWFTKTTKGKINLKNGVLDIDTMELLPHSPAYGFLQVLPYDYNAEAKAPRFEKMLEKVTGGNENSQKILMEYIAYILEDEECWTQKALMLVGDGANGKSTLANVITSLVGQENCTAFSMTSFKRPHTLSSIYGKLLNISEETQKEAIKDPEIFKSLTSGGQITDREVYKKSVTWNNKTKLLFMCNDLPDSSDPSHGFYRRLIIIPFDQVFSSSDPDFDPFLDAKLRSELSGIFNVVMKGLKRLKNQRGFTENTTNLNVIEDYREAQDDVYRWYKNNLKILPVKDPDQNVYVKKSDLYENYREMMGYEGIKGIETIVSFYKRVRKINKSFQEFEGQKSIKGENDYRPKTHKVVFDVQYGHDINLDDIEYSIEVEQRIEDTGKIPHVSEIPSRNYDGINV